MRAAAVMGLAVLVGVLAVLFLDPGPCGEEGAVVVQQARLRASDAQPHDVFGFSLAVSHDVAVVGAFGEDGGPGSPVRRAGSAYVFERRGDGWAETASLRAPTPGLEDEFGVSVAISDGVVIIGAPLADGPAPHRLADAGAAYLFRRRADGTEGWRHVATLRASDAEAGDRFGFSVGISGQTAIVGARAEDGGPASPLPEAGAAYAFSEDAAGRWHEVARLSAPDPTPGAEFGFSVAIDGELAVVGAPREGTAFPGARPDSGSAYVFQAAARGSPRWSLVERLVADSSRGDRFGFSVSISGTRIVVGALRADPPGRPDDDVGMAYVLEFAQDGRWHEVAGLSPPDGEKLDLFGESVAISGDRVVVGAYREGAGPGSPRAGAGAAYLFERVRRVGEAPRWVETAKLMAEDAGAGDEFGVAVAISDTTILSGARHGRAVPGSPEPRTGAAYVFEVCP